MEKVDWATAPDGWLPLAQPPTDGEDVEGLLSNGRTTEAEWWGSVPEELRDASGDGSGWAWSDGLTFCPEVTIVAWRPWPNGNPYRSPEEDPCPV
jgi:hypothetical protein